MYSLLVATGESVSFGEALGNMIVGLGVVFLVLLFLSGVISLFKQLGKLDKSKKAPAKAPVKAAPKAAAAPAAPAGPAPIGGEDGQILAVILAAVAQECGPGATVTSIVRSN